MDRQPLLGPWDASSPRIVYVPRPPYGWRNEVQLRLPCSHVIALIPEAHQWTGELDRLSVSPSIVCPHGDYHGFLVGGAWQ